MRVAQRRGVTISATMNCGFKPSSQAVVVFVMKHSGIAKCTQPKLPLTKPATEVAAENGTLGPVPIHRGLEQSVKTDFVLLEPRLRSLAL